ncbi:hypothetical protein Misp01_46090 [Microtetraspora sp. NBRC 13810]|uniref:hypothetical protein n=1 Tax=Microtetraspora sp. NBRC 13810 TaxID=3030990 RepID=UPI0024A3A08C|nr:hypothetical protein [Microtetraspora sp. NBRC 13810]GLW09480.1 hypothetical protein Misp01_46090 [Microtetraspora sp. NBRC 13810]
MPEAVRRGAEPAGRGTDSARQGRRLPPALRKTVTVVHVVASVALIGEVWALVVLNVTASLTDDIGLAHAAYRLLGTLVFTGGIPLSVIALISGIVLALTSRWGLVRHYWVLGKLVLLVATVLAGMFLFDPEGMAAAAEGAAAVGGGRRWEQVGVVAAQLAMLLAAAVLSVFKPLGRIRPGRA